MGKEYAEFKDKELRKALKKILANKENMEEGKNKYIKFVAPIAQKDVANHFAEEQGPKGPWDDWSASYQKFLKKKGMSGNLILQMSGRLRQSVVPAIGEKGKKNAFPILVNPAKTKKGFPYALHHDSGKSSHKGKPREFMWLSQDAMEDLSKATLQFLLEDV